MWEWGGGGVKENQHLRVKNLMLWAGHVGVGGGGGVKENQHLRVKNLMLWAGCQGGV